MDIPGRDHLEGGHPGRGRPGLPGIQEITGLAVSGRTLTGVGFTATPASDPPSGSPPSGDPLGNLSSGGPGDAGGGGHAVRLVESGRHGVPGLKACPAAACSAVRGVSLG